MYFYMHKIRILLSILCISIISLDTYANCPYCQQEGGERAVCDSCKEALEKIQRTLQGEETDMDLSISCPPYQLPGESSKNYPRVSEGARASITSLVSSQPYSLGSDMVEYAIPMVHNFLLTLRPQFSGIQGFQASGAQTILEHTQPAIFSNSLACSDDFTSLSSPFITGINNLLQQTVMLGTAGSWMSIINAVFQSFQSSNPQTSHFVWITENNEDVGDAGWIFIEIYSDGNSVLFNWNFHPSEDSLVAITKFQSKDKLINYLRQMLRNSHRFRSGFC